MKRFRIFIAASILTMITAVAFARSSALIIQQLYASTSSTAPTVNNSVKLTESVDLVGFSTTGTNQAQITNNSLASRYVYAFDGTTFTALYASGW